MMPCIVSMLRRLLLPAALLTLTWGDSGPSNYCRDPQGYFYHCEDTSWGSGSSWRRWYGEGGFSDLSRSRGRGQVTFEPSGSVVLTCDFSQSGRSGFNDVVTDIVWRKVERSFSGTFGGGSYSGGDGFSGRTSYVNIGSVEGGFRDRYDGYDGGNYVGGGYGGGNYFGGNYNSNGGGYYGNGGNGGSYYSNGGGFNGNGGGYYGSYNGNSMGSFSGGYVRDDYVSPSIGGASGFSNGFSGGAFNGGFSGRPSYTSGFYGSGPGFSSGCGGPLGCGGGGGGGGGGCGGRPWYRCLDSQAGRRRRHALSPAGGRPVSCWVTQGPNWSSLTLNRPGPADEGLYLCLGRSGDGSRAVSMEVQLSRYTAGGRYRSALLKTQPDSIVDERDQNGDSEQSLAAEESQE